jgi:hypothetical protein
MAAFHLAQHSHALAVMFWSSTTATHDESKEFGEILQVNSSDSKL